jgi:hypothetical protein
MDLAQLQQLKHKLLHDKELAPIWSFFFDNLAADPEFIALGQKTEHEFVEAVVAQVARQLFPKSGGASSLLLNRLPEQQFIHGGFFVAGRPGGVVYFEEGRIGLIAIADLPPSIEVKYARFSNPPIRTQGSPSRN